MDSPADKIIDLYERRAREWVADRDRTSFAELGWLERFSSLLPGGGSVLDIGCGSGRGWRSRPGSAIRRARS